MTNRLRWLDGLKGIGILQVILVHCWGRDELPYIMRQIIKAGGYWVQLFFVISSFLIFSSLERFYSTGNRRLLYWYVLKLVRLIPLYYTAIIIYAILFGGNVWKGNDSTITVWNYIAHFAFMHGFFPKYANSILYVEWYLGVLAIWITISPWLFRIIRDVKKTVVVVVASPFICSIVNTVLRGSLVNSDENRVNIAFIDSFFIVNHVPTLFSGILLYYIIKNGWFKQSNDGKEKSHVILVLTIIFMLGEVLEVNDIFGISRTSRWGLCFLLVIISQLLYEGRVLKSEILVFLGKNSYSIYLFHYLVIIYWNKYIKFDNVWIDWGARYFGVTLISIVIAFFSRGIGITVQRRIKSLRNSVLDG